ncbi:MAG: carbon-nitrogen hydrolase family protein, partial [Sedimentisphaerales bacterium]|nr:carbon-nitrogen hydrolase family protein [Sedimentisphaerales bacterium]
MLLDYARQQKRIARLGLAAVPPTVIIINNLIWRNEMFAQLIATTGPSVWGILLVAIILVAAVANAFARFKAGKVAMCQIFILDGDRRGNFVRIENAIAEAKSKGADIICFPAATMLGWVNPDAHDRTCPIPGPDSDLLCELAKKYNAFLCVGLEEKEGDKLFNSAILIDDRGQILLKHREINIAPNLMNPPYTPGSDVGITDTRFGKTGLLICSDTQQEDILDRMAAFKPALLLVPYAYAEEKAKWPGHGQELQRVVKNVAMRTGATVVGI